MEQPEMASKETLSRWDTLSQWATMTLSVFAVDFGLRHLAKGRGELYLRHHLWMLLVSPVAIFLGMFGVNYYLEYKR